ncbi:hypothetical protein [Candidatus Ichthyocystis hellenicum]|uniref:hypothetical protein n=1 Tax=Candidatus Ichthyocystis hellenicum TaxID=1561003 RepID=UPI000B821652|nr:hypothetical protein [Candidatus Ichthyocystis hellenicum]
MHISARTAASTPGSVVDTVVLQDDDTSLRESLKLLALQQDDDNSLRVSLKLLTQLSFDNSPVLSIAEAMVREGDSTTEVLVNIGIAPKNYMVPSDRSTYRVNVILSNTDKVPEGEQFSSVEIRPFMAYTYGRSPSMSLISVDRMESRTSIKLEAMVGSARGRYELIVDNYGNV